MRENYTGMDLDKIKCEDLFGTYREIASLLGVNTAVALYHTYRGAADQLSGKILQQ